MEFFVGSYGIQFGILSYAVTVSWFLLFIIAVNLIDGLNGLAAGARVVQRRFDNYEAQRNVALNEVG